MQNETQEQTVTPKLNTAPEIYDFDPNDDVEDSAFSTIEDLQETYENLKVVRFVHPKKPNAFIKFLVKRCDPTATMLTFGTDVLRSAIRLASLNERVADKDATIDIFEFIDDLRLTKNFMVLTVAMGLVEPSIPAKQINEVLPDYMLQALSAEINRGVVILDTPTSEPEPEPEPESVETESVEQATEQ